MITTLYIVYWKCHSSDSCTGTRAGALMPLLANRLVQHTGILFGYLPASLDIWMIWSLVRLVALPMCLHNLHGGWLHQKNQTCNFKKVNTCLLRMFIKLYYPHIY